MTVVNIPGIIRGGQVEKYADGDRITGTVGAAQAATGGLFVEGMAGDRVFRTAQASSMITVGLAIHDAAAAAKVTVAMQGVWMALAQGAIPSGSRVIPSATVPGAVAVSGATPDARSILGKVIADGTDTNLVPAQLR